MTKAEIILEISMKTGYEKEEVTRVIETFMLSVKNNMLKGENIYLRGFGGFILKKRAAKKARLITKNQEINLPEHYIPSFKPAKQFTTKIKTTVKEVNKNTNEDSLD